jgi:hypothetical protein
MAHNESRQLGPKFCELVVQRLEALQTTTSEGEETRVYWLNDGRAMLTQMAGKVQAQAIIAPCGKRSSDGSSSSSSPTQGGTDTCTPQ